MKKIRKISIVMLLVLAMLTTSIYAANISLKAGISADKQKANPGDNITINVSLKDFEGTGSGVNAFKATLSYDKDVFEEIELESGGNSSLDINPLNRWDTPTYNSQTGELITTKGSFVKANEDIIQISLKIKSNAKEGTTVVALQNISASNDTEEVVLSNVSTTIKIEKEQTQTPPADDDGNGTNPPADDDGNGTNPPDDDDNVIQINPPANGNNTGGNGPISSIGDRDDNTNKTPSTNKIQPTDNTTATGKLPQTGASSILVIAITIIAINAVVAFIRYKKVK